MIVVVLGRSQAPGCGESKDTTKTLTLPSLPFHRGSGCSPGVSGLGQCLCWARSATPSPQGPGPSTCPPFPGKHWLLIERWEP